MPYQSSQKPESTVLSLPGGLEVELLNKVLGMPGIAAMLHSPESGIGMKLYTDQPGETYRRQITLEFECR